MTRRSATVWAEMVSELDASGMTVGAFAARRGINASTLAWWRWKVHQMSGATPSPEAGVRFLEVTVAEPQISALRLRFERLGLDIEVGRGFDPDLLRAVVGALC